MDRYVKRGDSNRSRSVSGDSSVTSVSYRTSTPAPSASRTPTPLATSDISLSDVELDPSQLSMEEMEESGTEQEAQRKRQEGTRQLKAMLGDLENIQYAQPLVSALLGKEGSGKGFYGRFADQLQDADVLTATALHPHYTMSLVRHFTPDQAADIKDRIVREVKDIVGTEVERQPEERKERVDKFHLLLSSATVPEVRRQEEVEETIVKTLEDWKREMVDIPLSPNLFPARYRDAWLDLFKRYNTPLPSSAAVERLFSSAGDILRAKRSSLSNINFEQLVFVRGNMHLLGYKEVQQQHKEEEKEEEEEEDL